MWEMEGDYGKGMGNEGKGEEIGCKQIGNWRTTLENQVLIIQVKQGLLELGGKKEAKE